MGKSQSHEVSKDHLKLYVYGRTEEPRDHVPLWVPFQSVLKIAILVVPGVTHFQETLWAIWQQMPMMLIGMKSWFIILKVTRFCWKESAISSQSLAKVSKAHFLMALTCGWRFLARNLLDLTQKHLYICRLGCPRFTKSITIQINGVTSNE